MLRARLLSILAASLTLTAVLGGASVANGATDSSSDRLPEPRTRVTFTIDDCDGCSVQLTQARRSGGAVRVWQSQERLVDDGKVRFFVATHRTRGMSASVRAPWEGNIGYRTLVAWRYNADSIGETVTLDEAVDKRRAAPCWAGTGERRMSIPLVIAPVEVDGPRGSVTGTIAFADETQRWLGATRRAHDGVLGSQGPIVCQ